MSQYWFRKRRGLFSRDLGWGWTPISLEGWLVVLGMILYFALISFVTFSQNAGVDVGIDFLIHIFFAILIVCAIAHLKTERKKNDSKKRMV